MSKGRGVHLQCVDRPGSGQNVAPGVPVRALPRPRDRTTYGVLLEEVEGAVEGAGMIGAHAWNEHLDLGHEAMDHEHHLQVALVSAVADAIEQGRPAVARRLAAPAARLQRDALRQ